jgi:fatty acid desaturase
MPATANRCQVLDADQRVVLRSMVARDGRRSVITILADWAVVVAAVIACELLRSPWVYAAAVVVIARQMNALSELHHHAMHGNLFRRKPWNRRLQIFYSLPLWTTIEADLEDHMDHHRNYNTTEKDYLSWGSGYGLDLARRTNRSYMVYFLWIRPLLGPLQLADLRELVSLKRLRSPAQRPVVLFWLAALGVFALAGRLDLLFFYWLVPRLTIFPVFFFWEDMLGHYNCPLTGTRDFRGLWFWIFSPHGTAFHNVHHLCPSLPWFNMAAGTRLLVDETHIDVAHGFLDGMRQLAVARD